MKIMQSLPPPFVVASLLYLATFEYTSDIADKIGLAFIAVLVKVLAWTVLLFYLACWCTFVFTFQESYQSGRDTGIWGLVPSLLMYGCGM